MMKTVCYIAHPDVNQSSSQQYLLESGLNYFQAQYVNLYEMMNNLVIENEQNRLLAADQIIFQFPMYWYQAPGILFEWINQVWSTLKPSQLKGKTLGIVVVVGGKKEHYQSGGREGRTVSELLSNFEVLARHFKMNYKPIFAIHQFQYMNEQQKAHLMWRYLFYLETKEEERLTNYHRFIIARAKTLIGEEIAADHNLAPLWQAFISQLEMQEFEIEELMGINLEEDM